MFLYVVSRFVQNQIVFYSATSQSTPQRTTRCLVELTPEQQSRGNHHHSSRPKPTPPQRGRAANRHHQNAKTSNNGDNDVDAADQDLIQRVSDIKCDDDDHDDEEEAEEEVGKGDKMNLSRRKKKKKQQQGGKNCASSSPIQPQPLQVLLRERLAAEGIRLDNPPFTSKVRRDIKVHFYYLPPILQPFPNF